MRTFVRPASRCCRTGAPVSLYPRQSNLLDMTKTCFNCKVDKPLSEYGVSRVNKDGLQGTCKGCRKVYNLSHLKEKADYDAVHRVAYCISHRKEIAAYYIAHREEIAAYSKARYASSAGNASRKIYNQSPKARASNYKQNARRRNLPFELSDREAFDLFTSPCYWCGGPGFGIDRVRNDLGYIAGNCVPCCTYCNRAKLDHSVEEFIEHCRKVTEHQEKSSSFMDGEGI